MTAYPVQTRTFSNSPTCPRVKGSYRNSRLYPVRPPGESTTQRPRTTARDPLARSLCAVAVPLRARGNGGPARVRCCSAWHVARRGC